MKASFLLIPVLLLRFVARAADAPDLRLDLLAPSLKILTDMDRRTVDAAVQLIQKGENTLALAQLLTLSKSNPKNSSLRILAAYTSLKLGDLVGALNHSKTAEKAPDHTAYACWFLAKVAVLKGDTKTSKREIKHISGVPEYREEARKLAAELNAKK
ncbi:MAG: hypothetical protein ACRD96_23355 [Bryobacteraceae bacterium]